MSNTVRDHSKSQTNTTLGVAKKLSRFGLNKIRELNSPKATPFTQQPATQEPQQNPESIMRTYMPNMFGKHYSKVSQFASFVSPQAMDHISDYLFKQINDFSNQMSSIDAVLQQAGVKSIDKLSDDVLRSGRISQALIEQNKWLATTQGALTGALGVVGSGIDIPLSLFFALKTVYQTGRAYGFVLDDTQQESVEYIFKNLPLEDIAEKQTLLLAVRSLAGILQTNDIDKLQNMFGSTNDITWLKNVFETKDWNEHLPKLAFLTKCTPMIAAGVSATYSWKLIENAGQTAQHFFSVARDYMIQHPQENLTILVAYQKANAQQQNTQTEILEEL